VETTSSPPARCPTTPAIAAIRSPDAGAREHAAHLGNADARVRGWLAHPGAAAGAQIEQEMTNAAAEAKKLAAAAATQTK
jgi:hypothetical protein